MDETTPRTSVHINAPHRTLLDQVLDKWSLQILDHLCHEPLRFNGLRRLIPAISQKSLSATLRKMERNGIVSRTVISTRPISVEYRITTLGKTLRDPIEVLINWASQHLTEIEAARDRFDES